jgi:hypothetical protein
VFDLLDGADQVAGGIEPGLFAEVEDVDDVVKRWMSSSRSCPTAE